MDSDAHIPVMADRVKQALAPKQAGVYIDATFGCGGHTMVLLDSQECVVWAVDRDLDAVARARALEQLYGGRLIAVEGRFSQLDRLLPSYLVGSVDGVVFDLGMSSWQLDRPERGFSFRYSGPLDMRMSTRQSLTAADLVARLSAKELTEIFSTCGNERYAKQIAQAIVSARASCRFERTDQLAELIRSVVPRRGGGIDPATRSFQALRIRVNDELGELEAGLNAAERLLAPGGRLVAIAFHSLEDKIVKHFIRPGQQPCRHVPYRKKPIKLLRAITTRPLRPGADEIAINPRARSARLRIAERIVQPREENHADIDRRDGDHRISLVGKHSLRRAPGTSSEQGAGSTQSSGSARTDPAR